MVIKVRSFLIFCILAVIGLVSFSAYQIALTRFNKASVITSLERLSLYRATLRSSLQRLSHLPDTVSIHPDAITVINGTSSRQAFSEYLFQVNEFSQGAALYVLDNQGTTIASSNYKTQESFVGNNYAFRPYFTSAMDNEQGRIFAVGATTGRPGFFVSKAIKQNDKPIGVVVIKTEFEELLNDWRNAGENVLISDQDGVVILSTDPQLTYSAITNISPAYSAKLVKSRKFGNAVPSKLEFISDNNKFEDIIILRDIEYNVSSLKLPNTNWKMHYLIPYAPAKTAAWVVGGLMLLLCALFAIAALFIRGRAHQKTLKAQAAEAERIRQINKRLKSEVKVRRKAETKLRETQAELIQSSRLAALGTMSAAIVHEVNQPVSAIRTFSSSGKLLTTKGRKEDVLNVFEQISSMTERLGAITSDLLVFSRKPVTKVKTIDLNIVINSILKQYSLLLKESNTQIKFIPSKEKILVRGSNVRFEQLISNLIKNAMQACPQKNGKIIIQTRHTKTSIFVEVTDNGKGIPEPIKDQLFDPFFTTKKVGKGVGLGLALCYAIVDEAGGKITADNAKNGGAVFTVKLPKAS